VVLPSSAAMAMKLLFSSLSHRNTRQVASTPS
jgi:hypothetical protein